MMSAQKDMTESHNKESNSFKKDFPVFSESMEEGRALAYLDSASSAQKPQAVIDALSKCYEEEYANIHRGLYKFSQVKTKQFEAVRNKVASFINAPSEKEIIFTKNTTEAINLVANTWGWQNLKTGDEIILSQMEHHANIVPWQMIAEKTGAIIKVIPLTKTCDLDIEEFKKLLSPQTKLVSITAISNALGVVNPVKQITEITKNHNKDIKIIVDGSQGVVHGKTDVKSIGCDFYVFTGHKLYAPAGTGVLWGKSEILESMPPYQGGGDMIDTVTFEKTTYAASPAKFEAGTPDFPSTIALGTAIDYVETIGMDNIHKTEQEVMAYALTELAKIDGINLLAHNEVNIENRAGIISFTSDWAHISDIAMILDKCGAYVRSGHHCCMPLMQSLGIDGTLRASLGLYSDKEDIDVLLNGLGIARRMLS
jgi:cysteine desulfurase/selenocysteine lyase